MYCLVLLALVASVSADGFGYCPAVSPVQNFNFASYGQGTWYEYARYQNNAEINGQCGKAEYTLVGDVVTVKNTHVSNHRAPWVIGTARLAPNSNGFGQVIHTLPYGPGRAFTDNLLNILAIDYNNYVIGYYCRYDPATSTNKDFVWILTRSKNPTPETKVEIENFVRNSPVLDFNRLMFSDFSVESCTYLV